MSHFLEVRLSDEQLDDLAERIASKMTPATPGRPLNAKEAAQALNVKCDTVYRWIKAGHLKTLPGIAKVRIPIGEIERLQSGRPATSNPEAAK